MLLACPCVTPPFANPLGTSPPRTSCFLSSNSVTMNTMGAAGAERVGALFTWDKVAKRVIDGYHKVL